MDVKPEQGGHPVTPLAITGILILRNSLFSKIALGPVLSGSSPPPSHCGQRVETSRRWADEIGSLGKGACYQALAA